MEVSKMLRTFIWIQIKVNFKLSKFNFSKILNIKSAYTLTGTTKKFEIIEHSNCRQLKLSRFHCLMLWLVGLYHQCNILSTCFTGSRKQMVVRSKTPALLFN